MYLLHFYRPQRSWTKVIFSQACVILSTGGVYLVLGDGVYLVLGGVLSPGEVYLVLGGVWSEGVSGLRGGLVPGGL